MGEANNSPSIIFKRGKREDSKTEDQMDLPRRVKGAMRFDAALQLLVEDQPVESTSNVESSYA
jgi:hypothetical protein